MKAKVYIAPTQYAYRAAEDGQSIQFLDTTLNLGWKHSDYMTDKVLKAARPAQEVLDEEAARRGWQPWEEPKEQADKAQSNAVQLAAILVDQQKKRSGEMTAEGFKKGLGTGGSARSQGFIDYDYKGVSIRPIGEPETKYTWAKFLKFCRENGLIDEKSLKAASKPVSERAEENPIHAAEDAPPCAPTVSDVQPSPFPSSNAGVPTEESTPLNNCCKTGQSPSGHCGAAACCNEPYECCAQCPKDCNARCGWISAKEENVCTKYAPKPAAAATTNEPVVATSEETSTTLESAADAAGSKPELFFAGAPKNLSVPASPADAGAASQSLSAAAPASSEAQPLDSSAFDFGADAETNAMLLQDAQIFMAGSMARVMAAKRAHDRTAHNYRGSWGKWCELVGISRDTGDNMVRVAEQFGNIQVDGHNLIDLQPMKLLYAASRPSTPPEVRAKVESLEITSSKQFQELLARLKAKEQELEDEKASRKSENAAFSELLADEQQRRQEAEQARIAAEKAAQGAKESYTVAQKNETLAIKRAKEAESQLSGARDALTAAKARGDRWQEKCEALEAQAAAPAIEARVVDPEEVEQLAAERAEALAAQQMAQRDAEDARAAYDAVILATRSMDAAWQALAPMLPRLAPEEKGQAIHQFVNKLMCIKEDVLKCL